MVSSELPPLRLSITMTVGMLTAATFKLAQERDLASKAVVVGKEAHIVAQQADGRLELRRWILTNVKSIPS